MLDNLVQHFEIRRHIMSRDERPADTAHGGCKILLIYLVLGLVALGFILNVIADNIDVRSRHVGEVALMSIDQLLKLVGLLF